MKPVKRRTLETLDFEETIDDYKKQIFDLNTMLEIGKTLNASLSLKDVLDIIVLTCNGHFHSSDAVILLSTDGKDQPYFEYASEKKNIRILSSDPFIHFMNENQGVTLANELKNDTSLKHVHNLFTEQGIHLVIPLRFKDSINGILCLKEKEKEFGTDYTEDEKNYVEILAGFASVAIANARLYEIATVDMKTKLYNHGYFLNQLIEEIARSERYKSDLALMMIDIDHFKKINDTFGHMTGDEVLIKVAHTLRNQVRAFDVPARFGGEEFAVILPETDRKSACIVAERLRRSIEALSFTPSGEGEGSRSSFGITISIGVAGFLHSAHMTDDILIELADRALYQAKQKGRNQVVLFTDIDTPVQS